MIIETNVDNIMGSNKSRFEEDKRELEREDMVNQMNRFNNDDEEKLEQLARMRFHERIKNYDPYFDGNYYRYVKGCKARYELECIPVRCRYGRTAYDNKFNNIIR
jgi:hypothetical protein